MLTRNANGKTRFMRFVSQMMAVLLVIATVITVSPRVTKAAPDPSPTPLTYASHVLENGNNRIVVTFNTDASPVAEQILLENVLIKRSGSTVFVPLKDDHPYYTYISQGKLNINFYQQKLTGSTNEIKILANTLTNADGGNNAEINFALGNVDVPQLLSTAISSDNKTVTLTLDRDLFENSELTLAPSYLTRHIYLSRDGNMNFNNTLYDEDHTNTATIQANKLILAFNKPLYGNNNVIRIESGALKDEIGVVNSEILSHKIISSIEFNLLPYLDDYYVNNTNHDIVLEYNKNIVNHTNGALKDVISVVYNAQIPNHSPAPTAFNPFADETTTVTINENKLVIHFATALPNEAYKVIINSLALVDSTGNVVDHESLTTNWIYINGDVTAPVYNDSQMWNNYTYLTMYFNEALFDNTGESSLRSKIQISRNGGPYTDLDVKDLVVIDYSNNSRLAIVFNQPQHNNFRLKLAGGSLKDWAGNVLSTDTITNNIEVEHNAPDLNGNFYTNVSSEIVFEDNATWRLRIKSVSLMEKSNFNYNNWVTRVLKADEYTIYPGRIVINADVFKENSGEFMISINADGYSPSGVRHYPFKSTDSYLMTIPQITRENGITASVKILQNDYQASYANSSIIFQLMDGIHPVSIVSVNAQLNYYGSYTANFNVDPNNNNYTVRAFLVNRYSNDPTTLGVNLATVVTPAVMDYLIGQWDY